MIRPHTFLTGDHLITLMVRPNTSDATVCKDVISGDCYKMREHAGTSQSPLVIDIGANIGAFSRRVLAYRPEARIRAYEAHPLNAGLLEYNLRGFESRTIQGAVQGRTLDEYWLIETPKDEESGQFGGWNICQRKSGYSPDGQQNVGFPVSIVEPELIMRETWGEQQDVIVKLDCEGSEFYIIDAWSKQTMNSIDVLVGEMHMGAWGLDYFEITWREVREKILDHFDCPEIEERKDDSDHSIFEFHATRKEGVVWLGESRNPLTVFGAFPEFDGYGDITREAVKSLSNRVPVSIQCFNEWAASAKTLIDCPIYSDADVIGHGVLSFQPITRILDPTGKRNAVYTMFEADELHPDWVAQLNKYDVVIVPSSDNKLIFEQFVDVPVHVVAPGRLECYEPKEETDRKGIVFGSAGNLGHGRKRKGIDQLLRCFLGAFKNNPDVRLELKINPSDEHLLSTLASHTQITTHVENWPHEQCAQWLSNLNYYVDLSRYEAWGYWPFNATMCGTHLITAPYGGKLEWLRRYTPLQFDVIKASGGEVIDGYQVYSRGRWAEPVSSHVVEVLKEAADYPTRFYGRPNADLEEFNWARFSEETLNVLTKYAII